MACEPDVIMPAWNACLALPGLTVLVDRQMLLDKH